MIRDRRTVRGVDITLSTECVNHRDCSDCTDESCGCSCHREDEEHDETEEYESP